MPHAGQWRTVDEMDLSSSLLESVDEIPKDHLDATDTGIEWAGQKDVRHPFGGGRHAEYSLRGAPHELHGAPPPTGVHLA